MFVSVSNRHSSAVYLRKITQDFRHLIATFATTDVNDRITVGEFRQGLRNDRFATTESTWNSGCTTLDASEHGGHRQTDEEKRRARSRTETRNPKHVVQ